MANTKPLSKRQSEVYELLEQGLSQTEIAKKLGIKNVSGVWSHVQAIKKKGHKVDGFTPNGNGDTAAAKPKAVVKKTAPAKKVAAAPSPAQPAFEDIIHSNGDPFATDARINDSLASQRRTLEATAEAIEASVRAHNARQQEIEAAIKALRDEDAEHEAAIGDLNSRHESVKGALDTLAAIS